MASSESFSSGTTTIVLNQSEHAGLLAGLLGCAFGILGIFTWGLIFVPLAALCSLFGFVRGIARSSASGVGVSILAGFLTIAGFAVSPSLWVVTAAGLVSHEVATSSAPPIAAHPDAVQQRAADTKNFIASTDMLISRMNNFDAYANAYVAKFAAVEQRYHSISSKMGEYLNREQSLAGDPSSTVARSQISVILIQGQVATDQIHIQAQSVQRDLDVNAAPLRRQIVEVMQTCHQAHTATVENPVAHGNEAWNKACLRLFDAYEPFKFQYEKMVRGLASLEASYQEAKQEQEEILASSDRID